MVVKAAMGAALSSHVSSINIFSDSKNLILLLKTQEHDVVLKNVLHDIRFMARSFTSISFHFIPRLVNVQADSAALFSITSSATSAA